MLEIWYVGWRPLDHRFFLEFSGYMSCPNRFLCSKVAFYHSQLTYKAFCRRISGGNSWFERSSMWALPSVSMLDDVLECAIIDTILALLSVKVDYYALLELW